MSTVRHRVSVQPNDGWWNKYVGFVYEAKDGYERLLSPHQGGIIRGRHAVQVIAKARKVAATRCDEIARDEARRAQEKNVPLGACS